MASWVNHTAATMQTGRRSASGSESNSSVPGIIGTQYATRSSRSQQQHQQQQQPQLQQQAQAHPQGQQFQFQPQQGYPMQPQQQQQQLRPQVPMQMQQQQQQQHQHQHQQQQQQQQQPYTQIRSAPPAQPRYPANNHPQYNPHQQYHHPSHHTGGHRTGAPIPMVNAFGTFSTYSSRIREASNALILPPALGRRAKRAAVASMMESDEDDWDFEDGASTRSTPSKIQRMMEKERLEKEKKAWVKRPRKTRHIYSSQTDMEAVADQDAILVPIRIEIDTDEVRLRDTFTWNVNEQLMTPEKFAEILCEDLDLNHSKFVPEIAQSLRSQIAEFEPIAEVRVPNEGSRVVIQLDLHVGGINLRDRFEWDVGSDLTPEEFAKQLAADLGIGGEFVSMIAHEIHEQLFRFKQDRLLDRGFDSEPLYSGFRPTDDGENWCPALETLTSEEYEKILEANDRNIRRNRRETSRYGNRRRGGGFVGRGLVGMGPGKRGRPSKASRMNLEVHENWQCQQCGLGPYSTVMIRSGPGGEKTLCNTCGIHFTVHGVLPEDRKDLFIFTAVERSTPTDEAKDDTAIIDATTAASTNDTPVATTAEIEDVAPLTENTNIIVT